MKIKEEFMRGMLIFGCLLVFVLSVLYIGKYILHKYDEGIKHPKISLVKIKVPNCTLPENKDDIDLLVSKLRNSGNWRVSFAPWNNDDNLGYLYAAKKYERGDADEVSSNGFVLKSCGTPVLGYRVAIIDTTNPNTINRFVSSDYLLTNIKCKGAQIIDLKTYPAFKYGIKSILLVANSKCGVLIEEWSNDEKRIFTEKAISETLKEIAKHIQTAEKKIQEVDYTIAISSYRNGLVNLWKITSSGSIHQLESLTKGLIEGSRITTSPLLSREKEKVAYVNYDGNIWIQELNNNHSWQATNEGDVGSNKYFPTDVLLVGWSWDGQKLLYEVQPVVGGTDKPDRTVRNVISGYHVYDLKAKHSWPISIKGTYTGWDKRGDLLFQSPYFNSPIIRAMDPKGNIRTVWENENFDELDEISFHPYGTKILAIGIGRDKLSSIIEITMNGFGSRILTARGKEQQFRNPSYSPSGKHIAWLTCNSSSPKVKEVSSLFVDGRAVYELNGDNVGNTYHWINDEVLALVSHSEIIVLKWDNRKVVGRQAINSATSSMPE